MFVPLSHQNGTTRALKGVPAVPRRRDSQEGQGSRCKMVSLENHVHRAAIGQPQVTQSEDAVNLALGVAGEYAK
jgi:hypothetical protein